MEKIVILGANGQLGKELNLHLRSKYDVYPLTKLDCDISNKYELTKSLNNIKPSIIINAAAYTNVDDAETEFNKANNINNTSLIELSKLSNSLNSVLIHFSTDYVFSGSCKTPIPENAKKKPINSYGKTKHLGEENIIRNTKKYYIFRIGWVYGKHGDNFPKKIISLAKNRKVLKIIDDQIGIPTSTKFLAKIIEKIIKNKNFREVYGGYNLSPNGSASWYSFAKLIIKKLENEVGHSLKATTLIPVKTHEFPAKAKRPKYTCLSNEKIINMFKINPQSWEIHFNDTFKELL